MQTLFQQIKDKKKITPLSIQLILILLSCLFVAVFQGTGFLEDSHYAKVLVLVCIFSAYFGLLFYLKTTKRLMDEDIAVTMIIFLGVLLRCSYVLLSGLYERQHDVGVYTGIGTDYVNPGHIGYIEYIYKFHKLPDINPYELFAYYHPPLHHILSFFWLWLNTFLGAAEEHAFENLQVLPLLYSCLCMVVTCSILKLLNVKSTGLFMGLSFMAFHPAVIIMAGSVNNDMLTILFMCLTILFSLMWIRSKNLENLVKLALSIGFGMITKLNSAILAIPLALVFLLHMITVLKRKNKKEILKWIRNYFIFGAIAAPIGLSWIVRNLIHFGEKPGVPVPGEASPMYTGAYSLWSRLGIPSLSALRIDFPFHPISAQACNNTWAIMLHTSLFAEEYPTGLSDILLVLCQITFVLTVIFSIVTAILLIVVLFNQQTLMEDRIFLLTSCLITLVSFAAFVIMYPYTCSSDFRYVAVCLVYISIALGLGNQYCTGYRISPFKSFREEAAPVLMHIINAGILTILALVNIIYIFWERW